MTSNYHTPIPEGAAANADTFNDPLGQMDEALSEALLEERDGHIIQEEGVDLAQQARLDFVGAGVSVANSVGKTTVTVPGGITDHGGLSGLSDDDHTQYHNDTRGDARYPRKYTGKTTAPTVNDDSGDGYGVGDLWLDETNNKAYTCLDATAGAAVWLNATMPIRLAAPQGRLTLESGVAVSQSDQLAKTTLYYTPYDGNQIELHDGARWDVYTFSELSLSLSGLTANRPYDIFAYLSGGAVTLEANAWINDNVRNASLILADGRLVRNTNWPTRLYLGTIRITGTTGQCEDSVTKRFVWNYYNRVERLLQVLGSSGHTYTTTTARYWNNDSSLQVEFVIGWQEDHVFPTILNDMTCAATSSTSQGCIGLGINSTSALSAISFWASAFKQRSSNNTAISPALGYNYIALLEIGLTGCTFSVAQTSMLVKG